MNPMPGISQILHLPQTDSTQTVAHFLAEKGASDRTLVWADRQTAGRGRLERKWASPKDGLYFSLVIRPSFSPQRLADLSLMTSRAAAAALTQHAGIETLVKPPNDVLGIKKGKAKKICGILIEASGGPQRLEWVAVGVGINVNSTPPGLPDASSLKDLTGKYWDLTEVLRGFLKSFFRSYEDL
ncbi:MAG: biotin--[acetyl-CoA-carboxylase] ligase [Elusimicrobia bacterium RIFCSPHIGHO2_02_FULL_57_9]|nr:MAG: biotin--[acetyl-CoA-carboxylase] ligase [Elusimicrobia bacterium RIFCSPHIGHO2_02_FULL_57_9]